MQNICTHLPDGAMGAYVTPDVLEVESVGVTIERGRERGRGVG